jgi:small nuclear ribonucleoprotein (snRNP)-like protein
MNMVLDDAVEILQPSKKKDNAQQQLQRTAIGRILLKGDAVTLLQYVFNDDGPTDVW